jgi:hypothetical protein
MSEQIDDGPHEESEQADTDKINGPKYHDDKFFQETFGDKFSLKEKADKM